jgi:hypothetical protein
LTTREALVEAGVSYWQFVAMLRSNKVKPPRKNASGAYVWTAQDVANVRKAAAIDLRRKEVAAS